MTVLTKTAPGSDTSKIGPINVTSPKLGTPPETPEKVSLSYWLLIPFAFVTALSACLLHNFFFCESRIVLATDGKHFLTTTQLLVQFLNHVIFHAPLSPTFLADSQLAGHILLDGPLMSSIYAPLFVVLGKVPDPRDWMTLVIAQSIMHAISTSGLVYLVLRVTRVPLFAAVAILLYGMYPAAILQSGHFMSELPVTMLLIGFLLSLTGTKSRLPVTIIGGIFGALIALSKPALMPCIAVVATIGILRANGPKRFSLRTRKSNIDEATTQDYSGGGLSQLCVAPTPSPTLARQGESEDFFELSQLCIAPTPSHPLVTPSHSEELAFELSQLCVAPTPSLVNAKSAQYQDLSIEPSQLCIAPMPCASSGSRAQRFFEANRRSAGNSNASNNSGRNVLLALSNRTKTIIGLLLGASAILIAWSAFSYAATGKFNPTAQRQPLYNVVTGWNPEANGWAFNPHPPSTDLYTEQEGPINTVQGIWTSYPTESIRLGISKLSRLSSCPWNDFKGRALGLDANAQILFHRLVLCFAAFGAAIYFWCARRFLNYTQRTIVLSSFAIVFSHLAYLMVECQPRYTFTAMPFVVLLAAYGIWQAAKLPFDDKQRRMILASCAAFALVLIGALINAENICSYFDPRNFKEREHALQKNQFAEKLIYLDGVRVPQQVDKVFLLVDGNKNLEMSKIVVNGVQINEPLRSTMHFDGPHYLLFDQMREFAPAMRISVDDLRQWRAVPVSKNLINWNGPNKITITAQSKDSAIYSDGRHLRYAYSPDYCNYGILAAAPVTAGAESRLVEPILTAKCIEESFISPDPKQADRNVDEYDKNEHPSKLEKLKGSLRIKLAVGPLSITSGEQASATASELKATSSGNGNSQAASVIVRSSDESASNVVENPNQAEVKRATAGVSPVSAQQHSKATINNDESRSITIKVDRKSFDPVLYDTNSFDALRMNKTVLYAARRIGADFPVAKLAPASHLSVKITGDLKALHNAGEVGILCAIKGKNGNIQILGKNPRALQAKPNWREFEIHDLIPTDLLGGEATAVELALYPCPWMEGQYGVSRRACDALFKNIKIKLETKELPSLVGKRRIIY